VTTHRHTTDVRCLELADMEKGFCLADGCHYGRGRAELQMEQAVIDVWRCDKRRKSVYLFPQVSFLLARFDRILGPIYQINIIILRSDSCTTPNP